MHLLLGGQRLRQSRTSQARTCSELRRVQPGLRNSGSQPSAQLDQSPALRLAAPFVLRARAAEASLCSPESISIAIAIILLTTKLVIIVALLDAQAQASSPARMAPPTPPPHPRRSHLRQVITLAATITLTTILT
ncbi:hypothetical protein [Streptomyces sp. NPDC059215]|uniref:hypothetical protein n=1 Tax=Streptomyces sp. NPDC059215 TaxID=3346772 RepID=UPI0036AECEA9